MDRTAVARIMALPATAECRARTMRLLVTGGAGFIGSHTSTPRWPRAGRYGSWTRWTRWSIRGRRP